MTSKPDVTLESLLADIDALPRSRAGMNVDIRLEIPEGPHSILLAAARARRLSTAAFIKRAAYAMACFDLGFPLSDALTRDPRVSRENGFAVTDPDGVKFGQWEIEALRGP
jgi:hypothetical protein